MEPRSARIQSDGPSELSVGLAKLEVFVRNPGLGGMSFRGICVQLIQLLCDRTLLALGIFSFRIDID